MTDQFIAITVADLDHVNGGEKSRSELFTSHAERHFQSQGVVKVGTPTFSGSTAKARVSVNPLWGGDIMRGTCKATVNAGDQKVSGFSCSGGLSGL